MHSSRHMPPRPRPPGGNHVAAEDSAIAQLMHEVDLLEVPESAKEAFRQVLRGMVGRRVHMSRRVLVEPRRVNLALSLLGSGMSRPDVQRALVQRAQVSKTKAYRLARKALCERQFQLFGE